MVNVLRRSEKDVDIRTQCIAQDMQIAHLLDIVHMYIVS